MRPITDADIAWLRARLDEDEQLARHAAAQLGAARWHADGGEVHIDGDWGHWAFGEHTARHIARWDPQTVLDLVRDERSIIAEYVYWRQRADEHSDQMYVEGLTVALQSIAARYIALPDLPPAFRLDLSWPGFSSRSV